MAGNFIRNVGRLALDRFDFIKHVDGTDFRQRAHTIDLNTALLNLGSATTVQEALDYLNDNFSGGGGGVSYPINLSTLSNTTGILPIVRGGTGLGAIGVSGTVLTSNGTSAIWNTIFNVNVAATAAIEVTKLAPGTNGQVLTTVAGVPAWGASTSSPGGSNTQLQYNNAGVFGGTAEFTYQAGSGITTSLSGFYTYEGGTLPATGFIRLPFSTSIRRIITRKDVNGTDQDLLSTQVDILNFGNDLNSLNVKGSITNITSSTGNITITSPNAILSKAGSHSVLDNGNNVVLYASASGPAIGGIGSYGSGIGVLSFLYSSVLPTTNPTGGIVLYPDAADGYLKYRKADGQIIILDGYDGAGGVGLPIILNNPSYVTNVLRIVNGGTGLDTIGSANTVLKSDGASASWGTIVDAHITAGANIAVSKLAPGSNGQVLLVSGGIASWGSPSSGSPGGSNTQVQYNNSGSFGGSAVTYNGTTFTFPSTFRMSSGANTATISYPTISNGATLTIPFGSNDTFVLANNAQTLTNKSISASNNTITNLADANIANGAAIAVAKLAAGSSGQVLTTVAGVPTWSNSGSSGGASVGLINTVQTSDGAGGFLGATGVLAGLAFLSVSSPAASAGSIRLANAGSIVYRNFANTGNTTALQSDSSDALWIGSGSNLGQVFSTVNVSANNFIRFKTFGSDQVVIQNSIAQFGASIFGLNNPVKFGLASINVGSGTRALSTSESSSMYIVLNNGVILGGGPDQVPTTFPTITVPSSAGSTFCFLNNTVTCNLKTASGSRIQTLATGNSCWYVSDGSNLIRTAPATPY